MSDNKKETFKVVQFITDFRNSDPMINRLFPTI